MKIFHYEDLGFLKEEGRFHIKDDLCLRFTLKMFDLRKKILTCMSVSKVKAIYLDIKQIGVVFIAKEDSGHKIEWQSVRSHFYTRNNSSRRNFAVADISPIPFFPKKEIPPSGVIYP